MDELGQLQAWYASQCDGDWEHEFGVRIETLDNPGWSVEIPLEGTELEGRAFEPVEQIAPERDWFRCWVADNMWHGIGGPLMLTAIMHRFTDWARAARHAAT